MKKFSAKRFSWKLARRAFAGIIIFDLVSVVLTQLFTDADKTTWLEWLFAVPFWTINFPGLPLLHFARDTANGATILITVLAVFLLGATFWSVVVGYYFGHRLPPNTSLEPTPVTPIRPLSRLTRWFRRGSVLGRYGIRASLFGGFLPDVAPLERSPFSCSAGFRACGCGRLSSRPVPTLATRDRNVCATSLSETL